MYIQGKFKNPNDDLSDIYKIREKVFIEEQGVPKELEFDSLDKEALFCVVYEESDKKNTVATGRLIKLNDDQYKIGRIAVLKEYRGKYFGDMVVRMLVNKAFMCGGKEVIVDAQIHAIDFYKKIGFCETDNVFEEAGIKKCEMHLKQNDICSKCQNHK